MTAPAPPKAGRLGGLDLARALMVVGMFAIHFYRVADDGAAQSETTLFDWAPVLALRSVQFGFVLVAGVALGRFTAGADRSQVRRAQLIRAAVLLPLGLLLQELDPDGVSVILQNLAVLFLIGGFVLGWSDRRLLLTATVGGLLATVALSTLAVERPDLVTGDPTRLAAPPLETIAGLLFTGTYPVAVMLCPFLLGIWMGRENRLTHPSRRLVVAAVVTLVGLAGWHLVAAEVTDRFPAAIAEMLDPGAERHGSIRMLGALCGQWLVVLTALWVGARLPRLTAPLTAMGRMTLTAYVAHLLVIGIDPMTVRSTNLVGAGVRTGLATALASGFAVWWLRRHRNGPLESALAALTRRT